MVTTKKHSVDGGVEGASHAELMLCGSACGTFKNRQHVSVVEGMMGRELEGLLGCCAEPHLRAAPRKSKLPQAADIKVCAGGWLCTPDRVCAPKHVP